MDGQGSVDLDPQEVDPLRIVVIGCGGGGCNTVHRLTSMRLGGVETIAVNTDRIHLNSIDADRRLLIGKELTRGMGTGGRPDVGEACMEAAEEPLLRILEGADLTFITAGMGGGTGTGSAPIAAKLARKQGSLVVSMVTTPFAFERRSRMAAALAGIGKLNEHSDMMLLLDNNRLMDMGNNLPMAEGLAMMDQLISEVIVGLVRAITVPSLINLDFADLRSIMMHRGVSTILYGEGTDPDGAVKDALSNPLLEVDYEGATGAMIHVTGGPKMSMRKITKVLSGMSEQLDPDAQVIFGARTDPDCGDSIRVMAVITGIKELPDHPGGRSHEMLETVLEEIARS